MTHLLPQSGEREKVVNETKDISKEQLQRRFQVAKEIVTNHDCGT
jgi:hypothetical protein